MAWRMWSGAITPALSAGTAILVLVAAGGWWLGRAGTVAIPFLRRSGVNLEGCRATLSPDSPPAVWLVAHLDSKSQLVPMLLRVMGVALCAGGWICLLALWGATSMIAVPNAGLAIAALISAIGALPLVGTIVGAEGQGALDNASGVATILAAAGAIDPDLPLGIIVTSAEELGLAGARAWVRTERNGGHRQRRPIVINCDGVDDRGHLVCMRPRTLARLLDFTLQSASRDTGVPVRIRGVLPGILVDAIAFTQASWPALTVSRGGRHSLARIHTSRDDLSQMTGSGVGEAARFVAHLAGVFIAQGER